MIFLNNKYIINLSIILIFISSCSSLSNLKFWESEEVEDDEPRKLQNYNEVFKIENEKLNAFDLTKKLGLINIISARSGETEDTTIADLSVGWQANQIKVGSFSRSERLTKWNECLRIGEELNNSFQMQRNYKLKWDNL